MTHLDYSSFSDALGQLERGLAEAQHANSSELLRDGVIQRFEYSHELAIKFLKRVLETVYGENVDALPYNDLLRTAVERGLIDDINAWFLFRAARNRSSHAYDAAIATDVFRTAVTFLPYGQRLLQRFHAINDRN